MMAAVLDLTRDDDAHVTNRLAAETIAWLGTTRRDGRPHTVPVWFGWDDPVALVFSPPTAAKVGHLRERPACTLALESADQGNDIVIVEGRARFAVLDTDEVGPRAAMFAAKYAPLLTVSFEEWVQGFAQPVLIDTERIVAWSKPAGELRFRVVERDP